MTVRGDRTRSHLLDVAERLYGARGVGSVSLREIRIAAGARNTAAMQFHFGDREGLIQALMSRHMPRIAEIQQRLYDAMVAEGRADDPRSMVEVLVRPSADYLTLGPSERAWVKIIADLSAEPDLEPVDMALAAPEPALLIARRLYERLVLSLDPTVVTERMVVLAQCTVYICATRARLVDAEEQRRVSDDAFVANLVDMISGALFAPAAQTDDPLDVASRTLERAHPGRVHDVAMERVDGIGGVFFKADDPARLSQWYSEHLGVGAPPESYEAEVWTQAAGPTVYAPFGPEHGDSPHLGPTGWGINFRVPNLDAMVEQLRGAGIEVEVDAEVYPNGRFAQVADPEGNAVQLWEPQQP